MMVGADKSKASGVPGQNKTSAQALFAS